MAEAQRTGPQVISAPAHEPSTRRRGRHGRGRSGRSRGTAQVVMRQISGTLSEAPATQDPPGQSLENASVGTSQTRGWRQGGRGPRRGRRGGSNANPRTAFGTQRAFGGSLTTPIDADTEGGAGLSGEAPEFVPGQPVVRRR